MTDLASGEDELSILDLFRIEAENHSRLLEKGLVTAELNQDTEPLMRAAHSLKGAARIAGLDLAVDLAHAMEDSLSGVFQGRTKLSPDKVDIILRANDIFVRLAKKETADMRQFLDSEAEKIKGLVENLRVSLEGRSAALSSGGAGKVVARPILAPEKLARVRSAAREAEVARKTVDEAFIRVRTESMRRLIAMTGELLVHSRSLEAFSAGLDKLKNEQRELSIFVELDILPRVQGSTAVTRREGSVGAKVSAEEVAERRLLGDKVAAREELLGAVFNDLLGRVDRVNDLVRRQIDSFELFAGRLERMAVRLYNEALVSRMCPFSEGVHGIPRMVRDLARQLGKTVRFEIRGGSVAVDRDILEKLEGPIVHLLRNSIDHGLEAPAERLKAGKSEIGSLILEAQHQSGMLIITVQDDGRGIDHEMIRCKIVEEGRATAEMAARLGRAELLEFIFLPGFSTAVNVTEISGRGFGLNVVHSMLREVGGSSKIESQLGQGTVFRLMLPITLSVLRAVLAEVNGVIFALPIAHIDRLLMLNQNDIRPGASAAYFHLDNERIGLVMAQDVFHWPRPEKKPDNAAVVVISEHNSRYGLQVDRFIGSREIVVMPLDERLGKIPNISAASLAEDGRPLLIMEVEDLGRSINHLIMRGGVEDRQKVQRILIVEDSLTVREMERRVLEGKGYEVVTAIDGADAWNLLQVNDYSLVITDVDMPRMDGVELTRKMRAAPRFRGVPVMMISYKGLDEDRWRAEEAGVDYYLTKGNFQGEILLQAVQELLARQS